MNVLGLQPTARLRAGRLRLIDQTLLPARYEILALDTVGAVCEAIRCLRVRGAPALGVTAAYGLLVAIEERWRDGGPWFDSAAGGEETAVAPRIDAFPELVAPDDVRAVLDEARARLAATRPTAVNLGWALARMARVWRGEWQDARALLSALGAEADAILDGDIAMCRALGAHGAHLVEDGAAVLTHCNTGGLATGGFGTALGVVFSAVAAGRRVHVYADETRPLLQGARLTAWECARAGVPATVLVDGAAASLMAAGRVGCAIVGADRIAANGDTANKIGTLGVALAAHRFGVPFYVAAPSSSIDTALATGAGIPIEERAADEVRAFAGQAAAPADAPVYNPAFDVTPADLVSAIITERGIARPPYRFGAG